MFQIHTNILRQSLGPLLHPSHIPYDLWRNRGEEFNFYPALVWSIAGVIDGIVFGRAINDSKEVKLGRALSCRLLARHGLAIELSMHALFGRKLRVNIVKRGLTLCSSINHDTNAV